MELKINLGYEQLFNLANQLPPAEKEKLVSALKKSINKSSSLKTRELGKFKGGIWIAPDFNDPLEDFKEYM